MEDAHTISLNLDEGQNDSNKFFAVYDGHGGMLSVMPYHALDPDYLLPKALRRQSTLASMCTRNLHPMRRTNAKSTAPR